MLMVWSQRKLYHQSVKCSRESRFEQRQWLISPLHPFSLHTQPHVRKHLSAALSEKILAITMLGMYVYLNK